MFLDIGQTLMAVQRCNIIFRRCRNRALTILKNQNSHPGFNTSIGKSNHEIFINSDSSRSIRFDFSGMFGTESFSPRGGNCKIGSGPMVQPGCLLQKGITHDQISSFNRSVIYQMRSDGRGEEYKEGIGRSFAFEAYGYRGITITFFKKATDDQRSTLINSIRSNELVLKVFENTAPNDIKESDLR